MNATREEARGAREELVEKSAAVVEDHAILPTEQRRSGLARSGNYQEMMM
jgi:hypothetical protein